MKYIVVFYLFLCSIYESLAFLQLCNSADSARRKIDALKKEKDEVQTAIAEFQGSSKSRSVGNRDLYRDVDKYDQLADRDDAQAPGGKGEEHARAPAAGGEQDDSGAIFKDIEQFW